jgi:hypothetical protein
MRISGSVPCKPFCPRPTGTPPHRCAGVGRVETCDEGNRWTWPCVCASMCNEWAVLQHVSSLRDGPRLRRDATSGSHSGSGMAHAYKFTGLIRAVQDELSVPGLRRCSAGQSTLKPNKQTGVAFASQLQGRLPSRPRHSPARSSEQRYIHTWPSVGIHCNSMARSEFESIRRNCI